MKPAGVYLDEDIQSVGLIDALRGRAVPAVTTSDAGMSRATDEQQLAFAVQSNACWSRPISRTSHAFIGSGLMPAEHIGG